ncbi:MAG: asparaginase [Synergistaceae bacterium]|nr:asparaginase [Synergistaceae bacterium]
MEVHINKMENRDKIVVLLAGGRIVQRQDGRELTDEELFALLPEDLRGHVVFQKWSFQPVSNYTLRMCGELISMVNTFVHDDGARGVVVTCGIPLLAELSYFADLVWNLNPPLIFTGSIFNAGSSGSETSTRLTQSVRAALSGSCTGKGALICIQDAIYAPADVLRISNFNRAGLLAFPESPLGVFSQPSGNFISLRFPRHRYVQNMKSPLARNIPILTASLGDSDLILRALLDKRSEELDGLVISGLGDGDVPSSWVPMLRKIMKSDVPIVLTSRYPDGIVQATENYEGSASQLLETGLINGGMLSPYQARIKLAVGMSAELKGQELADYISGRH